MYSQQSEYESHTDNKESNDIFINSNQIVQKLNTEAETNDSTFVRNRNIPELKTKGRENDSIFGRHPFGRHPNIQELKTKGRENDSIFGRENDSIFGRHPFGRHPNIQELKTKGRENDSIFGRENDSIFGRHPNIQELKTKGRENDSIFGRENDSIFGRHPNIQELKTKGRENDSIFGPENDSIFGRHPFGRHPNIQELKTKGRENDSIFGRHPNIQELKTKGPQNDSIFVRNQNIRVLKTDAQENDSRSTRIRNIREFKTKARRNSSSFIRHPNIRELKTKARENDSKFVRNRNGRHNRKSQEHTGNEESDTESEESDANSEEFDKESEESDTDNEEFDTENEQYHTSNEESDTESVEFETVKEVPLSKALIISENTSIQEACRRMAASRVNGLMLTDSNALLCGILTSQDITTRVIAREVNLEDTPVSNVMTRNPVFVLSNPNLEAVEKMVQGKFKHLPVVEDGEVIGILDLGKCNYYSIEDLETIDKKEKAIADKESERADAKGKAIIATAVEGVEKHWATLMSAPHTYIKSQMFTTTLSTIIPEISRMVTVSPTDSVLVATKKMLEFQLSSAVIIVENKAQGILTSKDILMRVIVQNRSPESTLVEEVMTPNPKCASVNTTIADALSTMRDGKFSHLPVLDRDGDVVAVIDIIFIIDCVFGVTTMYQQSTNNSHDHKNEEELNTENEKFTYTDSEEPAAAKMAMPTARLSPVPSAQAVDNAFEEQ